MRKDRALVSCLLVVAMAAVDVLVIFDAFSVAYLLRFRLHLFAYDYFQPAPVGEYVQAMVVVSYIWVLIFYVCGLYDLSRHRSGIDTVRLIAKAVTVGTVLILSLTYFYRDFSFSRLVCIYAWALSIILFSAFRLSVDLFRNDSRRAGRWQRDVILVGSRTLARFLVEKLEGQPELGCRVIGVVDSVPPDIALPGCPYLGNLSDFETILDARPVDGVFIAYPTIGHYDLLEVIQACERRDVQIRMVPPTYDLLIDYRDFEEVDGIPLVTINEERYRRFDDLFKRAFDVAFAAVLVVVAAPIAGLIALAVRWEDGGPALFGQMRVGRSGRAFRMWKFRTMVPNAEALVEGLVPVGSLGEPVFKMENDPRVTRVGRWLRRTSLDELPQLINVLLGEMSLVGPRPEEDRLVRLYNVWERRRLKALPGITGLQQVECRGSTSLSERVRWDVLYVRKRCFFLDLWILCKTVWVVCTGKGAR